MSRLPLALSLALLGGCASAPSSTATDRRPDHGSLAMLVADNDLRAAVTTIKEVDGRAFDGYLPPVLIDNKIGLMPGAHFIGIRLAGQPTDAPKRFESYTCLRFNARARVSYTLRGELVNLQQFRLTLVSIDELNNHLISVVIVPMHLQKTDPICNFATPERKQVVLRQAAAAVAAA